MVEVKMTGAEYLALNRYKTEAETLKAHILDSYKINYDVTIMATVTVEMDTTPYTALIQEILEKIGTDLKNNPEALRKLYEQERYYIHLNNLYFVGEEAKSWPGCYDLRKYAGIGRIFKKWDKELEQAAKEAEDANE